MLYLTYLMIPSVDLARYGECRAKDLGIALLSVSLKIVTAEVTVVFHGWNSSVLQEGMRPKDATGMANSVDPDLAASRAVCDQGLFYMRRPIYDNT